MPTLAPEGPRAVPPARTLVGHDDRCSWEDHLGARCMQVATDTVAGDLYCSVHADLVAGI